jgi:uncharacterized membrane protein
LGTIALILVLVTLPWAWTRMRMSRPVTAQQHKLLATRAMQGLGLAFFYFALGHFVKTQDMVAMLPAWVPQREALIYATGVLELAVGAALLIPRLQPWAALAAAGVLIAFFPANVYAALNHTGMGLHQTGPIYLWIRTPLQVFLLVWTYWFGIRGRSSVRSRVSGSRLTGV